MSDPLTINCWIVGDNYMAAFPVEISRNKLIAHLKEAIKVERPALLNDIDAPDLILYKVSINFTPQLAEHVAALELNEQLLPFDELSEVFANGLPRKHVHVVVETPSGAWVYVGLSSLPNNQSQDAHVGTKRKSDERSVDEAQPVRESKRMSNPLYIVECR
jgi:hypothetical protein